MKKKRSGREEAIDPVAFLSDLKVVLFCESCPNGDF
jgi:hypothetical protein